MLPALQLDRELLRREGISSEQLAKYFPSYLLQPEPIAYGCLEAVGVYLLEWGIQFSIKVFLRPRKGGVGKLEQTEVNAVYRREAASYDKKHRMTTRGKDTMWRRSVGWFIVSKIRAGQNNKPRILDLCTGTGLAIKEMNLVLKDWATEASFVGLDYNREMLNAGSTIPNVTLEWGNATDFAETATPRNDGLKRFPANSFDFVTQIFGIGGIKNYRSTFLEALKVLKPGGYYCIIDMHRPIASQATWWPIFGFWIRSPLVEAATYSMTTIPLALRRLWGWHDPTFDFYEAPLTVWQDTESKWWGYKVQYFVVESQRWWVGLPVMPVGFLFLRKESLTEKEASERSIILKSIQIQLAAKQSTG